MAELIATPDLVEAAVRADRPELARSGLARLEAVAAHARAASLAPILARCRALLESGTEAERQFEEALRLHAASPQPFAHARTQLLFGELLRRHRRRRDAREHLRAALGTFERLGAASWAERARGELRATGETARRRDPSTLDQLTPQELQVARFVARGATNKEVAGQLFLSPRTIDYHLRKVFAKLAVGSRMELARMALDDDAIEPVAAARSA